MWCSPCRYSYGKAVKGTVWVTLCQKAKGCTQDISKDICREYSGLVSTILEDTWVLEDYHIGPCVKGCENRMNCYLREVCQPL